MRPVGLVAALEKAVLVVVVDLVAALAAVVAALADLAVPAPAAAVGREQHPSSLNNTPSNAEALWTNPPVPAAAAPLH